MIEQTDQQTDQQTLRQTITSQIQNYFIELKGQDITNLYDMVLEQIEIPLLQAVMEESKHNQSKAAETLGLSRGTLRKKLKIYFDDKYCG